ncbi:BREX-1 system phosphatase PglZ type B [Sinorhizobium meliloti]|uniref:BREX-1 system phosphatase PglZ type B n=1 Tax=Rhizobium meliloti TaxID=382 RepID=UPI00398C9EC1
MKVRERLQQTLRAAAVFNPEAQAKPACILWPDPERQWQSALPLLKEALPEMLVLGDYAPDQRTGPSVWLRCAIAGVLDGIEFPAGTVPILYLPGVARTDLRAINTCPDVLKPLAELQYRGTIWSQVSFKDWTVVAFFKSAQGGLGLDIAGDTGTRTAILAALNQVLEQEVSALEGKRLDQNFFNGLLTSGDLARDVLRWLNEGEDYRKKIGDAAWFAFGDICKSQLELNPQSDGLLSGAEKLALQEGGWQAIWERFREAPSRYPNIPLVLKKCQLPTFDLLADTSVKGAWPQWNDAEEEILRRDFVALNAMSPEKARAAIATCEKRHSERRNLIWADIGQAPLAEALKHLARLAEVTQVALAGGTIQDVESGYVAKGWEADDAALSALAAADTAENSVAIASALKAVYLPWADGSARHLQKLAYGTSYPGGTRETVAPIAANLGECILFVDGLRFDLGKRLAAAMRGKGHIVEEHAKWSALPSVTATAKPAVSPASASIKGVDGSDDFEPSIASTGQTMRGGYTLKKLLVEAGYQVLSRGDVGNPSGIAWTEIGDIDHEGHERGWKLARHLDTLIQEIRERVTQLLVAGWETVRIVTDHGWLLMPGGLPKMELPSALSVNKWGRCAAIKPGASANIQLHPWFWNPSEHFALADGISCLRQGLEYAHGGLSLQECLTLHLMVKGHAELPRSAAIKFSDIVWKHLRCTVVLDGGTTDMVLDIRKDAGDPFTSLVVKPKALNTAGSASVVVENEDLEGCEAMLVLTDANGSIVAQASTKIGGDNA